MECFSVLANRIEGRIDPHFYRPEFVEFYEKLKQTKFDLKAIGEITEKVTSGATPLSKGDSYTLKDDGIPFIRSGDINEDKNINFDEVLYIKKDIHNKKLKSSKLKKGDVLIAIVGATIGQVSIYDYDKKANINQAIALVRLKEEVNPGYVKAFMISTLGQKQLNRIKRPVARANINLDEIRGIKIILPSLEIQNKIVSIMEHAYKEQKNKEEEISEFLDSINDYVLDELGIKLPELKDKMTYVVYADDAKENRIDAYYYQPKFDEIKKATNDAKYPLASLKNISASLINGLDFRKFSDEGVSYARVGNIKPNKIDLKNIKYIPIFNISKEIKLETNDLLITRKGSFGIAATVTEENKNIIISSEIFKIRLLIDKVNPYYISSVLNTKLFKMNFDRIKTGGIMGHISQKALLDLKIPLPSLPTQNKIAEEVKKRIQKAEQLQKESKEEIEKAKQEVEKIILD